MSVAKAIRRARERAKKTQQELADDLGVAVSTVAGWETGAHGVRPHRLRRLAKALGVGAAELLPP